MFATGAARQAQPSSSRFRGAVARPRGMHWVDLENTSPSKACGPAVAAPPADAAHRPLGSWPHQPTAAKILHATYQGARPIELIVDPASRSPSHV